MFFTGNDLAELSILKRLHRASNEAGDPGNFFRAIDKVSIAISPERLHF